MPISLKSVVDVTVKIINFMKSCSLFCLLLIFSVKKMEADVKGNSATDWKLVSRLREKCLRGCLHCELNYRMFQRKHHFYLKERLADKLGYSRSKYLV